MHDSVRSTDFSSLHTCRPTVDETAGRRPAVSSLPPILCSASPACGGEGIVSHLFVPAANVCFRESRGRTAPPSTQAADCKGAQRSFLEAEGLIFRPVGEWGVTPGTSGELRARSPGAAFGWRCELFEAVR
eukprot:673964-Rhodomonas_salina.1